MVASALKVPFSSAPFSSIVLRLSRFHFTCYNSITPGKLIITHPRPAGPSHGVCRPKQVLLFHLERRNQNEKFQNRLFRPIIHCNTDKSRPPLRFPTRSHNKGMKTSVWLKFLPGLCPAFPPALARPSHPPLPPPTGLHHSPPAPPLWPKIPMWKLWFK